MARGSGLVGYGESFAPIGEARKFVPKGIGLIGFGTVGSGVVEILRSRRESLVRAAGAFELVGVAVRDPTRPRDGLSTELLTTPEALVANPRVDVLVEVAGGVEAPLRWVSAALEAGKVVVTANKALLAERAKEIAALEQAHPGRLYREAAVAGGIPILRAIDQGLSANRVLRVEGILNGTCNYVLSLMERERLGFGEALRRAQAKGFAEADPTLDVSGGDSAHKLAVLAGLVLERAVGASEVYTEGIDRLTAFDLLWAEQNGFRIKMLAIGRFGEDGVELRVHPTLVPKERLISQVMNEDNAVSVEGDLAGPQLYQGKGAGRMPTASAVVSDIVAALRGNSPWEMRPTPASSRFIPMGEVVSRHYLHLEVIDRPGVVATAAKALAEHAISIASMYQPEVALGSQVPVVLTTHEAADAKIASALEALRKESWLVEAPIHVRMR